MRDRSTMTKGEYLWENLIWGWVFIWLYNCIFFQEIPLYGYETSKFLLWSNFILNWVFGIILTYKKRRNSISVTINSTIPIALYITVVKLSQGNCTGILIYWGILIILSIIYSCIVMSGYLDGTYKKKDILQRRKRYCLNGSRTLIGIGVILILLSPVAELIMNHIPVAEVSKVAQEKLSKEKEYTIEANIDALYNIEQERWELLTFQQKLDLAQLITCIECNFLGIKPISVKVGFLEENLLAYYDDDRKIIMIDFEHLKDGDAQSILDTLLHENYHAMQHSLVSAFRTLDPEYQNLLPFFDIQIYEEELKSYKTGEKNFSDYYYQKLEIDAREHAASGVKDYYSRLAEYQAKQKGE